MPFAAFWTIRLTSKNSESFFPRRFGGGFLCPLGLGGEQGRPSHEGAKERKCLGLLFLRSDYVV